MTIGLGVILALVGFLLIALSVSVRAEIATLPVPDDGATTWDLEIIFSEEDIHLCIKYAHDLTERELINISVIVSMVSVFDEKIAMKLWGQSSDLDQDALSKGEIKTIRYDLWPEFKEKYKCPEKDLE